MCVRVSRLAACSLVLLLALAIVLPAASAQWMGDPLPPAGGCARILHTRGELCTRSVKLPEFDGVILTYRQAASLTEPITWTDIDVPDDTDVPTVVPKHVIGNYSCDDNHILLVNGTPLEPYLIYVCDTDPTNPKRSAYDPEPPASTLSCAVEIPYSPAPPPSPYPPTVYPPPPSPPRPRCQGEKSECGRRACCTPDETCYVDDRDIGLCCAANTTRCGSISCCEDSEDVVCFPKANFAGGLCCATHQSECGSSCCDPGQLCIKVPVGVSYYKKCCEPDKVCGSSCCRDGETCTTGAKNGVKLCCAQGSSPCGSPRKAQRCCKDEGQTCYADSGYPSGTGLCCPTTHKPCSWDRCCGPDQECVPAANFLFGGCCPKGLGCYWGCCKEGEVCKGEGRLSRCCDAEGNKCYTAKGRTPDF